MYPYLLILLIVALGSWIWFELKKGYNKAQKRKIEQKEPIQAQAFENLKNNSSTLMTKSLSPFISIPPGSTFIFFADEQNVKLQAKTYPPLNYILNYQNIGMFQSITIKEIKQEFASMYRIHTEKEYVTTQLHLEYQDANGENIICDFICGQTFEDRWYNEIAQQGQDIFAYVNARIPKQNTTITL